MTITPTAHAPFGDNINLRQQAVKLAQGTTQEIGVPLIDESGTPISLSDYSFSYRIIEAVGKQLQTSGDITKTGATSSTVYIPVNTTVTEYPGIYIVSIGFFQQLSTTTTTTSSPEGTLVATYDIYLYVEGSAWGSTTTNLPTISEIRATLRDSDPIESELLLDRQFGLEEICLAAIQTVELWNDTPPVTTAKTTTNFEYKTIWKLGIHYYLFDALLEWLRKNRLPYNAAGLQIDDLNKLNEYMAIHRQRREELQQLMMTRKATKVLDSGFSKIG